MIMVLLFELMKLTLQLICLGKTGNNGAKYIEILVPLK